MELLYLYLKYYLIIIAFENIILKLKKNNNTESILIIIIYGYFIFKILLIYECSKYVILCSVKTVTKLR